MMGLIRHLFKIFVSASALLLASCIDGREEIWLNANGSGRVDISYTIPTIAANLQGGKTGIRELIAGMLKDNPAISSSSLEVSTIEDRLKIRVQAAFDSALDLKELSQNPSGGELPASAKFMAGEVAVKREGLSVNFARTISPGKALPGAAFIPKSQTKDRSLTYIIHLPVAATDSNATRVEDAGCTLIWEFPLAAAIRTPVSTRFKAPIPVPLWIPTAILAIVSILVLLIFRKWHLSRNSRTILPVA